MKHHELVERVQQWSCELGVSIADDQASVLVRYAECVRHANERVNLTAITGQEEALRLHLVDSLSASHEVLEAPGGPLLDIGTGGGFPGVPLAVVCERHTTLLDSVGKKVRAVQECIERAGLAECCTAIHARSEEWARDHGQSYAVVVARAVADLPVVLELARPFVQDQGVIVVFKGSLRQEETHRGSQAAVSLGLVEASRRTVELPVGGESRTILSFRVVGPAQIALPRRPGVAAKRPLGDGD